MRSNHAFCVLLAPAVAHAAAFPWALPEPTGLMAAADNWSPAPTPAPRLLGFDLFKRQGSLDNTCGYVSGLRESSITCYNSAHICATNTRNGVGGCCDSRSLDSCSIPTTCIASSDMTKSCIDGACSSNGFITKCTDSGLPSCYKFLIIYPSTVMTQHGCASEGFTSTAIRTYGGLTTSIPPELYKTVTVTSPLTQSSGPTTTASPKPTKPTKPPIGVIVGGTVGGCTAISLIIIAAILFNRRRKKIASSSVTQPPAAVFHAAPDYSPVGFSPTKFSGTDNKTWGQHSGPVQRTNNAMPPYPRMPTGLHGIVEVDGAQRPVEAPAENIYYAQEYIRR